MQLPLVLAILSGVLYAVAALGYKMAERLNCRTATFIVVFSIAGGVFAMIKSFSETSEWKDPRLWLLGIVMGILFDLAIFLILRSNKNGPASISWTMLQLSLLVPVILSPMLFQERVYWIDPVIVAAFVLMLAFFAQSLRKTDDSNRNKTPRRYFLYLLGIFFSNGFFLLGNKLKYEFFEDNNAAALTFIVYLAGGLIAWLVSNRRYKKRKIRVPEWKAGALTGLSNSIGTILYLGAMSLPAPVVFPLSSSIALLGGVVLTAGVYGEKFDLYKIIGMVMGLVALLLAIFREHIVM
jgi:uncharacterized membrane protein